MERSKNAYKLLKNSRDKLLKIDFFRFLVVGSVGFIVTAVLLKLLHGNLKIDIVIATLIAGEGGLISNFIFHQNWTYKHHDHSHKSLRKKLLHFHMSSWSGVIIITIIETVFVKVFKTEYIIALVIASAVTLFWNFFWTRYFIFNGHTPAVLAEPEDSVLFKD